MIRPRCYSWPAIHRWKDGTVTSIERFGIATRGGWFPNVQAGFREVRVDIPSVGGFALGIVWGARARYNWAFFGLGQS